MADRVHPAARIEDVWHRSLNQALTASSRWHNRAVAHIGYGSSDFVRVLGRVVLSRHELEEHPKMAPLAPGLRQQTEELVRGWRAFITAQAMNAPVAVEINGVRHETVTDRSGYVDLTVHDHGLEPGWQEVTITPQAGAATTAKVYIVPVGVTFGIVSDIDDTVISTALPRPMIAAWNTFLRQEQARHIVPGMAPMYRELLAANPGAPILYLSTGAWNTQPTLTRFLLRHGYPIGPLLLTDWGPTNTGWFRSGQDHKRENLHRLAREFPHIQWVLVGDDGQHDPRIYGDFARDRPDVVRAIGIRELTPAEQVLSHGIPVSNEELDFSRRAHREVEVVRAGDGYGLLPKLRRALGMSVDAYAGASR